MLFHFFFYFEQNSISLFFVAMNHKVYIERNCKIRLEVGVEETSKKEVNACVS